MNDVEDTGGVPAGEHEDPVEGDESAARNALEKAGEWLADRAREVADDGFGPLSGSVAYARARLVGESRERVLPEGDDVDAIIARAVSGGRSPQRAAVEATIDRIIKESLVSAGTIGFVTGIGGVATLIVAMPADVAGNFVINSRMVGAVAYLRGYDLDDPHAQAMFLLAVAGSSGQMMASSLGVRLGQAGSRAAVRAIPLSVIHELNKRAAFYLVTKYGTRRAAATFARVIPFVGGVFSGGVNVALTASIGSTARKAFTY